MAEINPKILKKLEEMARNPKGILSICCVENCGKIKIVCESENWVSREDFPNPEIYNNLVEAYRKLGPEKKFTEGLSHGYCPEDFKKYMEELKK